MPLRVRRPACDLGRSGAFKDLPWAGEIARHVDALVAAVLAIVIAVILLSSVLVVPNTPLPAPAEHPGRRGDLDLDCHLPGGFRQCTAARRGPAGPGPL